jgi:hypothetical protein
MTMRLNYFANLFFRICIPVSSPLILVFIGLQSRPSADEYLLGPVLNGFYVDRTDGFLFEPSSNLFVRYFQGTKAIYQLGWDGLLNAATLQMGSSILVNYFGPIATLAQAIVFASVLWFFLYVFNSRILLLHGSKLHAGILIALIALLGSFAFADFNTYREHFGFFPFTGIRFGIYALSSWILILLVFYFEFHLRTTAARKLFYFSVVCFSGFVSLWFIMFWLVYLITSLCTCSVFRGQQHSQYKRLHLNAAAATFVSMLINHNLSSVLLNRTAVTSSTENDSLIGSLKDVLLENYQRLFSWELWNLSFGFQFLIGIGVGAFISFSFKLTIERVQLITSQIITKILIILFILPILFYMQEQFTYEAWWHRTPLIALSLISGLMIGVFVAVRHPFNNSFLRLPVYSLVAISFVFGYPKIVSDVDAIRNYRQMWDSGDPFGTQSPLANSEVYNQINLLKIKPYKPPNWKPSIDVLTHVSVNLNRKSNGDLLSLQPGEFTDNATISLSDSVLEGELFRELSVSFLVSISDQIDREVFLRFTDSESTKFVKLLPGASTTISLYSGLPGRIHLEDNLSGENSFRISDLQLDFGPKFKANWEIRD